MRWQKGTQAHIQASVTGIDVRQFVQGETKGTGRRPSCAVTLPFTPAASN